MNTKDSTLVSIDTRPWDKVGAPLTPDAPIEQWVREAGLFEVKRSALWFYSRPDFADDQSMHEHKTRDLLYRADTMAPLGIVSKGYKLVQPEEVLASFRELAEAGAFTLDAAGSVAGGKKIWALAKVGPAVEIVPGDGVAPYLLLATSFDGSLSTVGKFTSIRLRCNNALSVAIRGKGRRMAITHSQVYDVRTIRDKLGIAHEAFAAQTQTMRALAHHKLDGSKADAFMLQLLDQKRPDEDVRESTGYRDIMRLFEGDAIGSDVSKGRTRWQMLNAVTEFVDHHRGTSEESRMNAAWFGKGDAMKSRAYELLVG